MNTCANFHGKPSNSCWNISVETILMLTLEQKSIRSILLSWHIILQLLSYFHLDRLPDHEGKSFMTYSLRRKSGEHFLMLLSFVKTVHSFEMIKNSSYNSTLQEKELPEYNYIYVHTFMKCLFYPIFDHCTDHCSFSRHKVDGAFHTHMEKPEPAPACLPTRCTWAWLHAAVQYVCTHEPSHTPSGSENDSVWP